MGDSDSEYSINSVIVFSHSSLEKNDYTIDDNDSQDND